MDARAMRILFVDVETDGLPIRHNILEHPDWPHIVQAAWIVSDGLGNILRSASRIVKPVGFNIPADAVAVHGITTKMAREQGTEPQTVLHVLNREIERAGLIVAHNLDFDSNVINAESKRFGLPCSILSKKGYCTMKNTKDLTQLGFPDNPYPNEWKWPSWRNCTAISLATISVALTMLVQMSAPASIVSGNYCESNGYKK